MKYQYLVMAPWVLYVPFPQKYRQTNRQAVMYIPSSLCNAHRQTDRQTDRDTHPPPRTTPTAAVAACCPGTSCSPRSSAAPGRTDRTWRGAGSPRTGQGSTPGGPRCFHWPARRRRGPASGAPPTEPVEKRG